MTKRTPTLIALAILAVTGCASSASSSGGPPPPTNIPSSAFSQASSPAASPSSALSSPGMLSAGQPATLDDSSNATMGAITVEPVTVTTQSADGTGNTPQNGWFVVAEVKVAANSSYSGGFYISADDFYALEGSSHYDNGNGNAYDALTDGEQDSLDTTLAAGETTTGWISFDVPSKHGEIAYAPNSNGQPIVEWSY
jgi:hypothetical protein